MTERRQPRLHANALLVGGLALFAAIVAVALTAPALLAHAANDFTHDSRLGSSWAHPLGTDAFGRDMLARSLVAARLTVMMALSATALSMVVGVMVGAAIWLAPRRLREAALRVLETIVAYPGLLVTIVLVSILGVGTVSIVIAIAFAGMNGYARLTANLVAGVVHRDFVYTARLLGVGRRRLITRHILPNIAEPMLIVVSSGFGGAVLDLSGLSFIGLGVQSPDYDFGKLLIGALPEIYTNPIEVVGPSIMIIVTILSAMLIGDGLAAAANPRSQAHLAGRRARRTVLRRDPARSGTRRLLARRTAGAMGAITMPQLATGPALCGILDDASPMRAIDDEVWGGAAVAGSRSHTLVTVRDLRVRAADDRELLRGVSFSVRRGEVLGVVGESGSGKSLTAMALAALLPDQLHAGAARLRIGEWDMTQPSDPRELATAVSLIYQDPATSFSPVRRLGPQLTEVLRTHRGRTKAEARAAILDAMRAVRLTRPELRLRQFPHELSGGMLQRAMIAAALVSDPAFLIADEPTTGLDVIVQAEILRELKRINTERHTTMLFISHDMAVVSQLCDRIIVMRDGSVIEELTRDQMVRGDAVHAYTRRLVAAAPVLRPTVPAAKPPAAPVPNARAAAPVPAPILTVRDLSVTFGHGAGAATVLHDVDFDVPTGGCLGIVGGSGSGKSTIAKTVVGLLRPASGVIAYCGRDLRQLPARERRRLSRSIQLVPQDPYSSLSPRRTIGQSLAEALDPHRVQVTRHRPEIARQLARVQIDPDAIDRYPHEFSGGQRQRIAIARALMTRPSVIIADEITSSLDVSIQAGILELIATLRAELGLSVVFISHNLAVVQRVCTEVLVLRDGRVVEHATSSALFAQPAAPYTRLLISSVPDFRRPDALSAAR